MSVTRYDEVYWVPVARQVWWADSNAHLLDVEFSDDYRSPRIPAGWFILPSALLALLGIFIVL